MPFPTDPPATDRPTTGRRRDPLAAALLLIALAIFVHAGVQAWAHRETMATARETAHAERILSVLDAADPDRAAANLKSLIDLGLIADGAEPGLLAARPNGTAGMRSVPAMEDYDRNGNGRIDEGPEAEIFLLHANAPEIRLLDDDMDGTLDLPEVARYLEYMTDLRSPGDQGRQEVPGGAAGADQSGLAETSF